MHPNIWKLLPAIQEELSRSETRDLHRVRGDSCSQKKKYMLLNQRIRNQIAQLDEDDIERFLKNISNALA